ncbi:MAG: RNA 2',3'-cyclic phosphodiesterase [Pyrinomonadaceae bacterium]
MKRIFIAVDISEEARRLAAAHSERLRNEFSDLRVGWERAEKLHLTLRFIGNLEDERISSLTDRLRATAAAARSFELSITGTGVFPNVRRPRVLWLGVAGDVEGMNKLAAAIENDCEAIGLDRESREFKPHLTIARLRETERSGRLAVSHLQMPFESAAFKVGEIVLYESKLQRTGSVYSVLDRFSLGVQRQ